MVNKSKKGAKRGKGRRGRRANQSTELALKQQGQEYARATKMLGNGRLTAQCFDDRERLCHIRGGVRLWISPGDTLLVSLREFQDGKCDVLLKYTDDEVRHLRRLGELPENQGGQSSDEDGNVFEFEDVELDAL
jgi:initiation factor 1A